jgi:hypothetical protein
MTRNHAELSDERLPQPESHRVRHNPRAPMLSNISSIR